METVKKIIQSFANNTCILIVENEYDDIQFEIEDQITKNINLCLSNKITDKLTNKEPLLIKTIIENDIPERLIRRNELFIIKDIDIYLKHEAIWITKKIFNTINKELMNKCNNIRNIKGNLGGRGGGGSINNIGNLRGGRSDMNRFEKYRMKILKVLELLKKKHYEIMYIYTYNMNYINDDQIKFQLDILWKIYNLDREYAELLAQKEAIYKRLSSYPDIKSQLYEDNKAYIDLCFDANTLSFINSYIDYELMKIHPDMEIENPSSYSTCFSSSTLTTTTSTTTTTIIPSSIIMIQSPFNYTINDFFKEKESIKILKDFFCSICLTPLQFWTNIKSKKLIYIPYTPDIIPKNLIKNLLKSNTLSLSNELSILEGTCLYGALELYHHLPLREYLIKLHMDKVLLTSEYIQSSSSEISTDIGTSTDIGLSLQGKVIDIFNPLFPVKKIMKLSMKNINDELCLLIYKSQIQGIMRIKYSYPWSNEENLIVINELFPYYLSNIGIQDWNIIRKETLRFLLEYFIHPCIEKLCQLTIEKTAEKYIITQSTKSFKEMFHWSLKNSNISTNEEQQEGEIEQEQEHNIILGIIGDNNNNVTGAFIDEHGNYLESFTYSVFLCANKINNDANPLSLTRVKLEREKESGQFIKLISKYKPNTIVIGDAFVEMKLIRNIIKAEEETKDLNPFIYYYEPHIPILYVKSNISKQETILANCEDGVKMAICLARIQQDQMAEVLKLWDISPNENLLLQLPLHQDINLILNNEQAKFKLHYYYENIICEMISYIGIDINKIINNINLISPMKFIAGLGPIICDMISNTLKNVSLLHKIKYKNREELFNPIYENICLLKGKIIAKNAIGFIRIYNQKIGGKTQFDRSRIHPDDYDKALSILRGVFEEHDIETTNYTKLARVDPQSLYDIDLNDFASQILKNEGLPNYRQNLEFIIQEIISPFQDRRISLFQRNKKNFFYWMIGGSNNVNNNINNNNNNNDCNIPNNTNNNNNNNNNDISTYSLNHIMKEGNLIILQIKNVYTMSIECKMQCGKTISIHKAEVYDKEDKTDLKKEFSEGLNIKAKIKKISEQEITEEFWDILKIEVTIKPSVLRNHNAYVNYLRKHYQHLNQVKFDEEDDYPINLDNYTRELKFSARKIQHPKYHNISANEATHYLADKPIGDFIIRPSTRSNDEICITWKFYHYIYITIDIKEGIKAPNDIISNQLYVDKVMYTSLRGIIDEYIINGNELINQVIQHPKFIEGGDMDMIKIKLQKEIDKNPRVLPYHLSISTPYFINLSYIMRNEGFVHEWIKIDHKGFHFHDSTFAHINHLLIWFKEIRKKENYADYLKKVKPPTKEVIEIEDEPINHLNMNNKIMNSNGNNMVNTNNNNGETTWGNDDPCQTWGNTEPSNNNNNNWGEQANNNNNGNDDYGIQSNGGGGGNNGQGWGNNGQDMQESKPTPSFNKMKTEKKNVCYNCQESGHFASQCPSGIKKERVKTCRNCDEVGHFANSCPNPPKNGGFRKDREFKCRNCNQTGHFAKDCPEKPQRGNNNNNQWNNNSRPKRANTDEANTSNNNAWGSNTGENTEWGTNTQEPSAVDQSNPWDTNNTNTSQFAQNDNTQSITQDNPWSTPAESNEMNIQKDKPANENDPWGQTMKPPVSKPNQINEIQTTNTIQNNDWGQEESSSTNQNGSWDDQSNTNKAENHNKALVEKYQKTQNNSTWDTNQKSNLESTSETTWGNEDLVANNTTTTTIMNTKPSLYENLNKDNNNSSWNDNPSKSDGNNNIMNNTQQQQQSLSSSSNTTWGDNNLDNKADNGQTSWDGTNNNNNQTSTTSWGENQTSSWETNNNTVDSKNANQESEQQGTSKWGGNPSSNWGNKNNDSTQREPRKFFPKGGKGNPNNNFNRGPRGGSGEGFQKPNWRGERNNGGGNGSGNSGGNGGGSGWNQEEIVGKEQGSNWNSNSNNNGNSGWNNEGSQVQQNTTFNKEDNSDWNKDKKNTCWNQEQTPNLNKDDTSNWNNQSNTNKEEGSSCWNKNEGSNWGNESTNTNKEEGGEGGGGANKINKEDSNWGNESTNPNKEGGISSWNTTTTTTTITTTTEGSNWNKESNTNNKEAGSAWGQDDGPNWNKEGNTANAMGNEGGSAWGNNEGSSWNNETNNANAAINKDEGTSWNKEEGGGGGSTNWNTGNKERGANGQNRRGGFNRGPNGQNRNQGENGGKGRDCFKCGKPGHFARECPEAGSSGGGGGSKSECFKCKKPGHMAKDCTEPGEPREPRKKVCHKCNQEGHMARECPNGGGGGGGGGGSKFECYKCKKPGHMARDCTEPGSNEPRKKGCHICSEEGHFARECPNKDKFPRQNRPPRSRSRSKEKQDWRKNRAGGENGGGGNGGGGKNFGNRRPFQNKPASSSGNEWGASNDAWGSNTAGGGGGGGDNANNNNPWGSSTGANDTNTENPWGGSGETAGGGGGVGNDNWGDKESKANNNVNIDNNNTNNKGGGWGENPSNSGQDNNNGDCSWGDKMNIEDNNNIQKANNSGKSVENIESKGNTGWGEPNLSYDSSNANDCQGSD